MLRTSSTGNLWLPRKNRTDLSSLNFTNILKRWYGKLSITVFRLKSNASRALSCVFRTPSPIPSNEARRSGNTYLRTPVKLHIIGPCISTRISQCNRLYISGKSFSSKVCNKPVFHQQRDKNTTLKESSTKNYPSDWCYSRGKTTSTNRTLTQITIKD